MKAAKCRVNGCHQAATVSCVIHGPTCLGAVCSQHEQGPLEPLACHECAPATKKQIHAYVRGLEDMFRHTPDPDRQVVSLVQASYARAEGNRWH